jgi:hypothetical protein
MMTVMVYPIYAKTPCIFTNQFAAASLPDVFKVNLGVVQENPDWFGSSVQVEVVQLHIVFRILENTN